MPDSRQPFDAETDDKLSQCERLLGYRFSDRNLLLEALTHASGANHRLASNERLEFLGDAILGFLVCDWLYREFPEWDEGELTQVKSALVSRGTCGNIGAALEIERFLYLGKGMESNKSVPVSLRSDAVESIIAAIYLDGGIESVKQFILPRLRQELEPILAGAAETNFKSELQHRVQIKFGHPPKYVLVLERGPDHNKCFLIRVQLGDRRFTPAWGDSKKQAEQRAAANALAELDNRAVPFPSDS